MSAWLFRSKKLSIMSPSALSLATSQVPSIHSPDGQILTESFLSVCRIVLSIVEKLGTAFSLVHADINGNITRLSEQYKCDQIKYTTLFSIVTDEMSKGLQGGSSSCTKGILWLKRAMEFTACILDRLSRQEGNDLSLSSAVTEAYTSVLYPYHGFLASSAFYVTFNFLPTREYFFESLGANEATIRTEMQSFVKAFTPVLEEIHRFLVDNDLNDLTKV